MRPWSIAPGSDATGDSGAVAAAAFNFERLHPVGRRLILSYSVEGSGDWPELSAVECGPATRVAARTMFGIAVARGLVHCTGKQVIWT